MATNNRSNKGSTGANRSGGNNSSSRSNSGGGNQGRGRRARDSEGRFSGNSWIDSARERPYAAAAVAAGVAGVSAFLWSRRGPIGELAESGIDKLSELASDGLGSSEDSRSQREISEEANSLKETGASSNTMGQQNRTGVTAY